GRAIGRIGNHPPGLDIAGGFEPAIVEGHAVLIAGDGAGSRAAITDGGRGKAIDLAIDGEDPRLGGGGVATRPIARTTLGKGGGGGDEGAGSDEGDSEHAADSAGPSVRFQEPCFSIDPISGTLVSACNSFSLSGM